jgi:hypothetical protein
MDTSVYLLRHTQRIVVDALTIQDLALSCRLFMELAYPGGADTISADKRPYHDIPTVGDIDDYLPPAKLALCICQDLSQAKGGVRGYEFRLGSAHHPHLKLRIQVVDFHEREVWVHSVDTHDRFLRATQHLSPEEAMAWRTLTEQNRSLKHRIEESLAQAGYLTPKSLLQLDLTAPVKP